MPLGEIRYANIARHNGTDYVIGFVMGDKCTPKLHQQNNNTKRQGSLVWKNKQMKKLILCSLIGMALTGCGNGGGGKSPSPAPETDVPTLPSPEIPTPNPEPEPETPEPPTLPPTASCDDGSCLLDDDFSQDEHTKEETYRVVAEYFNLSYDQVRLMCEGRSDAYKAECNFDGDATTIKVKHYSNDGFAESTYYPKNNSLFFGTDYKACNVFVNWEKAIVTYYPEIHFPKFNLIYGDDSLFTQVYALDMDIKELEDFERISVTLTSGETVEQCSLGLYYPQALKEIMIEREYMLN